MAYELEGADYFNLWQYFQDRADKTKEAMFSSVTWAVGFSAALFGFIFTTLVDVKGLRLMSPMAVIGAAVIGLFLCGYSAILIVELKSHILRNWQFAARCKREVHGLTGIFETPESEQRQPSEWSTHYVWTQVGLVVVFFAACYIALLVWALASLST